MIDTYHSHQEVFDDKLDAQYLRQQIQVLTRDKREMFEALRKYPYFSPSSANSCKRELYEKLTGAKRDKQRKQPHQGRWQKAGTLFGDMLQRDLLFIEKYYKKFTGESPPFIPARTAEGYPLWEDFAQRVHPVEHRGLTFSIFGKPDGILEYKDGTRVGLEIKSKQTTAAQTGEYKMREPKTDHVRQVIAYSIMYGVDDFLIVYGNLSKKSWNMTEEDYAKNPDIRAFHVNVTESDRQALLDEFADVVLAVELKNPPPLNLDKFTFNNYKTACAKSLTEEELADIRTQVSRMMKSRLPDWKKKAYVDALEFIEKVREGSE